MKRLRITPAMMADAAGKRRPIASQLPPRALHNASQREPDQNEDQGFQNEAHHPPDGERLGSRDRGQHGMLAPAHY